MAKEVVQIILIILWNQAFAFAFKVSSPRNMVPTLEILRNSYLNDY
jgi:hypothetical protein